MAAQQHDEKVEELFDFLKFSHQRDNEFEGTVVFRLKYPDGSIHTKSVSVHPTTGVKVVTDDSPKPTCRTHMNRDTFFDVYSGKVHARDAVLSRRVKVDGWRFSSLNSFASAFDLSSENWVSYYAWCDEGRPARVATPTRTEGMHDMHEAHSLGVTYSQQTTVTSMTENTATTEASTVSSFAESMLGAINPLTVVSWLTQGTDTTNEAVSTTSQQRRQDYSRPLGMSLPGLVMVPAHCQAPLHLKAEDHFSLPVGIFSHNNLDYAHSQYKRQNSVLRAVAKVVGRPEEEEEDQAAAADADAAAVAAARKDSGPSPRGLLGRLMDPDGDTSTLEQAGGSTRDLLGRVAEAKHAREDSGLHHALQAAQNARTRLVRMVGAGLSGGVWGGAASGVVGVEEKQQQQTRPQPQQLLSPAPARVETGLAQSSPRAGMHRRLASPAVAAAVAALPNHGRRRESVEAMEGETPASVELRRRAHRVDRRLERMEGNVRKRLEQLDTAARRGVMALDQRMVRIEKRVMGRAHTVFAGKSNRNKSHGDTK